MNFKDYKAEDFLQDESFLNYCLAKSEEDISYWTKWIKANPEKEEEVKQAVELYHVLNGGITASQYRNDEKDFLAALDEYKGANVRVDTRRIGRTWYAAAAAAVAGALILIAVLMTQKENKRPAYAESSKAGERRSFQLPDGSTVMLNSSSTLTIEEGFNSITRELRLDGEAYFEVKHMPDRPFVVHTSDMDIKVLGTKFNVRGYAGEEKSETLLLEGSVEVTLLRDNNRKVVLRPQERISYGGAVQNPDASAETRKYDVSGITSSGATAQDAVPWTRNKLVFVDESFDAITRTLERWYGVNIVIAERELYDYRFTGTFENKTLIEVLEALSISKAFQYRVQGDEVVIKAEGRR